MKSYIVTELLKECSQPYADRGGEEHFLKLLLGTYLLKRLAVLVDREKLQSVSWDIDDLLKFGLAYTKALRDCPGYNLIKNDSDKVIGIQTPKNGII